MSLKNQPYLPLYVMDFMTDEKLRECSASSVGVYIMLICVLHKQDTYGRIVLKERDKKCDDNIANFVAKLRKHLPYDEQTIRNGLDELIEYDVIRVTGDTLQQKRMVNDEIKNEARSKAGSAGAKRRWGEGEQASGSELKAEPEKKATQKKYSAKQEEMFAEFWKHYPLKKAKEEAKKVFAKKVKDRETLDNVIFAVEQEKKTAQWKEGVIPHARTFLNQERWKDYDDMEIAKREVAEPDDIFREWSKNE